MTQDFMRRLLRRVSWRALTIGALGVGATGLLPVAAFAADAASASAQLEEVIVTAQKRTEKLQDVPISVQVVAGNALSEKNVDTMEELSQTVPGLHIVKSQYSTVLNLRGIGSGVNGSFDQSVATFVDDIYYGRSRMSSAAFLDLDRIEVLKGPQSTFFGNSAIGGALNIVTRKPGSQFDAEARALYGMHGQYALEGAAGGPVTDKVGFRVAATFNGGTGWLDNVSFGNRVPVTDNQAVRVTGTFAPSDDLDATLKIGVSKSKTTGVGNDVGTPSQWINCPPPAPYTVAFISGCAQALALGLPMGLKSDNTAGLPAHALLSTFENALTVNYHRWGHTFTSVTGFFNYHNHSEINSVLLPFPVTAVDLPERYDQFSQEFRVASPSDRRITYLFGVYYQKDHLDSSFSGSTTAASPVILANPAFAALRPFLPLALIDAASQKEDIYSIFGSVTFNLTDQLKLDAGLRSTRVHKVFSGGVSYGQGTRTYGGNVPLPLAIQPVASFLYGPPGSQTVSRSDPGTMPSLGLQYHVTPQAMAYVTYSRGFKAGGMNGNNANDAPSVLEFGPEHVNAYEAGVKSQWLNDTLRLNLDVFRDDFTGLQANASVRNPITGTAFLRVANVASSLSQGVEFEGQWALPQGIRLSANVTYLDSHYVSYPNAPQATLGTFCGTLTAVTFAATPQCAPYGFPVPTTKDISGQKTNFAPNWSGSLVLAYSTTLAGDYKLSAELGPYLTSSYYANGAQGNDPLFRIPGYVRVDARLGIEPLNGHWAVDLIGKNLTDRIILTSVGLNYASKEEPRNVALQLRYKW